MATIWWSLRFYFGEFQNFGIRVFPDTEGKRARSCHGQCGRSVVKNTIRNTHVNPFLKDLRRFFFVLLFQSICFLYQPNIKTIVKQNVIHTYYYSSFILPRLSPRDREILEFSTNTNHFSINQPIKHNSFKNGNNVTSNKIVYLSVSILRVESVRRWSMMSEKQFAHCHAWSV